MDDMRGGECRWCGEAGSVYADNGLCESCDTRIVKCAVCKAEQHEDYHCRHVFKDENGDWQGAGIGRPNDHVRRSFIALVDLMPAGFSGALASAIRSGRFHTWLVAPIIGGGGHLTLHGMGDQRWGDALLALGGDDRAEPAVDGYRWLVSLFDRKTAAANKATLGWIRSLALPAASP